MADTIFLAPFELSSQTLQNAKQNVDHAVNLAKSAASSVGSAIYRMDGAAYSLFPASMAAQVSSAYSSLLQVQEKVQKLSQILNTGPASLAEIDSKATVSGKEKVTFDYGPMDFIGSFGNLGKAVSLLDKASHAGTWNQWMSVIIKGGQTLYKTGKDIKNYAKISSAIGAKNAAAGFAKKLVGFRTVGSASQAHSVTARFLNNLRNETSPYNLGDAFAPLTGKKGIGTTAAAWAGVFLTGVTNAYSNLEEQKESGGKMSTGRVVAETITETTIDTVVTYAGTAVVGAAITAATGVVAAPAVVAVATGVAIAGINTGVKALTGKTATEWVSDAVLDTAVNVGKAAKKGAKAVSKWFGKITKKWGK